MTGWDIFNCFVVGSIIMLTVGIQDPPLGLVLCFLAGLGLGAYRGIQERKGMK